MRASLACVLSGVLTTACARDGFDAASHVALPEPPRSELASITVAPIGPVAGGGQVEIDFDVDLLADGSADYLVEVSLDGVSGWLPIGTIVGVAGELIAAPFSYAWSPVPLWDSAQVAVRVSTESLDGHPVVGVSAPFTVDSAPPSIEAGSFAVNLGAPTSSRRVHALSLMAADALTQIQGVCARYNSTTAPSRDDPCWVAVDPASSSALSSGLVEHSLVIPPVGGRYDFFVWLRDAVGNQTLLSNAGAGTLGLDLAATLYTPNAPAQLVDVWATSTPGPVVPFTEVDLTAPAGATVYVAWRLTDDQALPPLAVSLSYTTDEVTFVPIAGPLENESNGGCVTGDVHTGCFVWPDGSPTSSYFRVRAMAVDADGNVSATSSQPLNVATTFRVLAGNTDPGTGGTASAAMFINALQQAATYSDPQSFVVAADGTLYFRDIKRGILAVPPDTGTQELLIRTTGTASGDGGAVSSATLALPSKLILDHAGNLLVYDRTRIRKIDLSRAPPTIDTFIGGGSSKADDVAPRDVQLDDFAALTSHLTMGKPFFTTPNGDVYFSSEATSRGAPFRLRRLSAATGRVQSLTLTGAGHTSGPDDTTLCEKLDVGVTFDGATSVLTSLTALSFADGGAECPFSNYLFASTNYDPTTGVATAPHPALITGNGNANRATRRFTSHDGEHYVVAREKATIWRYDAATRDVVALVGTGTSGVCPDGTLALACAIDPLDAYVSPQGVLYFVDRGAIRIVHTDGRVYTVMGQRYNFGDGGAATSARFGQLLDFEVWATSSGARRVVLYDGTERRMRELEVDGVIRHIAGNGMVAEPVLGELATATPLLNRGTPTDHFVADAAGDIYYFDHDQVIRLDRATGRWKAHLGVSAGGVSYATGDGLNGATEIDLEPTSTSSAPAVVAASSTHLFVRLGAWDGSSEFVKSYDYATRTQASAMGLTGPPASGYAWCGDGLAATACLPPEAGYSGYDYDAVGSRLVVNTQDDSRTFGFVPLNGGNLTTSVVVTGNAPLGRKFDHFRNAAGTRELLFYCDAAGQLMKVDMGSGNGRVALPLPPTIACAAGGVAYDEARDSLVFVFTQNGLTGIGERLNP